MIKINLLDKRRFKVSTKILGLKIQDLNLKFLAISLLTIYLTDLLDLAYFKGQAKNLDNSIAALREQDKELAKKLFEMKDLKKELDSYDGQMNRLKIIGEQVDKILKSKANPKRLLERTARNVPEDLWLDEIQITTDREYIIKGKSISYKSIGDFLALCNESVYFGGTMNLVTSKTIEMKEIGPNVRVEEFEIKGKIMSF
jgi:Tfp pilus assembly protein PilN